jgi:hypothetical protein
MRYAIFDGQFERPHRPGDSIISPAITQNAVDANDTVTVAKLAGRIIQYTAFSAGRNLTTDTAANILASPGPFADMDIGDSFLFMISITVAFAGTYVAGAGVTLAGRATALASTFSLVLITKLTATTIEWRGL